MPYVTKGLRHPAEMKCVTSVEHCLIPCFLQISHFGEYSEHVCISMGWGRRSNEAPDGRARNRGQSSIIRDEIAQEREEVQAFKL